MIARKLQATKSEPSHCVWAGTHPTRCQKADSWIALQSC